jgi:leucyl/phenylalanyl-tRNA--protein transferase
MMRLPDRLEPAFLLRAYAAGIFPMADERGAISWYAPDPRAILDHDDFHVSRSLRATIRSGRFAVRFDTAFEQVMRECAAPRGDGAGTWISEEFIWAYSTLHRHGYAHSVEAWEGNELVGGLYGVSLNAAFMGESMYTRRTDASKVCLAALVGHLKARGYLLHDVQFLTPHLERLGARLISRAAYQRRLARALAVECSFVDEGASG